MTTRRRPWLLFVALLTAFGLLAAACGGSDASDDTAVAAATWTLRSVLQLHASACADAAQWRALVSERVALARPDYEDDAERELSCTRAGAREDDAEPCFQNSEIWSNYSI